MQTNNNCIIFYFLYKQGQNLLGRLSLNNTTNLTLNQTRDIAFHKLLMEMPSKTIKGSYG